MKTYIKPTIISKVLYIPNILTGSDLPVISEGDGSDALGKKDFLDVLNMDDSED